MLCGRSPFAARNSLISWYPCPCNALYAVWTNIYQFTGRISARMVVHLILDTWPPACPPACLLPYLFIYLFIYLSSSSSSSSSSSGYGECRRKAFTPVLHRMPLGEDMGCCFIVESQGVVCPVTVDGGLECVHRLG